MSSFEQPISQLEAKLAKAEQALEHIEKEWMNRAAYWPSSSSYVNENHALVAAIALVKYRRKALKRAKKVAGNVSDQFGTMSAGFNDEPTNIGCIGEDEEF